MNTPSRTLYICKVCEDGGRCWSSFYSEDEIYLHLQANTPRATHATPLICASDHAFLSRSSIDFNKGRLIRTEQMGEVGMGALESATDRAVPHDCDCEWVGAYACAACCREYPTEQLRSASSSLHLNQSEALAAVGLADNGGTASEDFLNARRLAISQRSSGNIAGDHYTESPSPPARIVQSEDHNSMIPPDEEWPYNGEESDEENRMCTICGRVITGYGHNAEPVARGMCCDECNSSRIIPARIAAMRQMRPVRAGNIADDHDTEFQITMSTEPDNQDGHV